MTLIVEIHQKERNGLAFISDCLTSDRFDSTSRSADWLPNLWASGFVKETRGVGLTSKALTGQRKIILNCGNFENIDPIARGFSQLSDSEFFNFQGLLDQFAANHPMHEGFIYALMQDELISHSDTNCEKFSISGFDFTYAGSGASCPKEILSNLTVAEETSIQELSAVILAKLVMAEFLDAHISSQDFGGAYELFYCDGERFRRVSYAVCEGIIESKMLNGELGPVLEMNRVLCSWPFKNGSWFSCYDFSSSREVKACKDWVVREFDDTSDRKDTIDTSKLLMTETAINIFMMRDGSKVEFKLSNSPIAVLNRDDKSYEVLFDIADLFKGHRNAQSA